jgi:hypothetical protein
MAIGKADPLTCHIFSQFCLAVLFKLFWHVLAVPGCLWKSSTKNLCRTVSWRMDGLKRSTWRSQSSAGYYTSIDNQQNQQKTVWKNQVWICLDAHDRNQPW